MKQKYPIKKRIIKKFHSKIINSPLFNINFKEYPKATIIQKFQNCYLLNLNGKKTWFKQKHIFPIKVKFCCFLELKGFFICKKELIRKGLL